MKLLKILALSAIAACSGESTLERKVNTGANTAVKSEMVHTVDGIADFRNIEDILVTDTNRNPLSAEVKGYEIHNDEVYLAKTSNEGGMAVFLGDSNKVRQYLERSVIIGGGVTIFDRDSQQVVYDLMQWSADGYYCDGLYTTEELIAAREDVVKLIAFVAPQAKKGIWYIYDNVTSFIDEHGLELPQATWYSLTPENPTGFPILIQEELALGLFNLDGCGNSSSGCPSSLERYGCIDNSCIFEDNFESESTLYCAWNPSNNSQVKLSEGSVVLEEDVILVTAQPLNLDGFPSIEYKFQVREDSALCLYVSTNNPFFYVRAIPGENTVSLGVGCDNVPIRILGEVPRNQWQNVRLEPVGDKVEVYHNGELFGVGPYCFSPGPTRFSFENKDFDFSGDHSVVDYIKVRK
jgi:hypothetical protein